VYDKLGVEVTEVGESFYNPLIPAAIEALTDASLAYEDQGMLIVMLPHFPIPLIVRKSDGGYGYDSTDMAALHYRTQTLQRDWLIYVTDAGQSTHFHMCFDAAREVGWLQTPPSSSAPSSSTPVRCDHIGFGVVCGDDGKRFKTRSSETVRLIDLLDAAKDRMAVSLKVRAEEGKSSLQGAELESAAATIGYGAVKYFDLKQNPISNYIFSYDRMLDTKGDTAVYLLFAYARLVSILRKGEERGIDVAALANAPISLDDPAERAMAFELLQLGDIIRSVLEDLLPNRLCDDLHSLATKFTDFVTRCHVLNVEEPLVHSRLLLCEATRRVMATCFQLLGIETLERI
jgi:arginyl-tRNA synthetase